MRHYFHVSRVNLRSAEEHSSSPWLLVLFCFQRKKGIIVKLDEPKVAKWAEVRQSHLKTYRKEEKFKNNSGKTLNLMWLTKCKVETIKTRQETGGQKNLKKKEHFFVFCDSIRIDFFKKITLSLYNWFQNKESLWLVFINIIYKLNSLKVGNNTEDQDS